MTLEELETQWNDLADLANADKAGLLAGTLDLAEYIERDLNRQAERRELEAEAKEIRQKDPPLAWIDMLAWIDHHLQSGTRHFRRASDGTLLRTLDEVVRALIEEDLL